MRVLLDENLPHDLRHLLLGHDTVTVKYMGWQGILNGELLRRAASEGFEVLLSMDAGLAYEQNLVELPIAVVLVKAPTNTLADLTPLVPAILAALSTLAPRTMVRVGN